MRLQKTLPFLPERGLLAEVGFPAKDKLKLLAVLLNILHLKAGINIEQPRQLFPINLNNQLLIECFFLSWSSPRTG
jgi:hypothetical protein